MMGNDPQNPSTPMSGLRALLKRLLWPRHQSMAAALAEQDRLRRELHHRVANNLQILASIISLQARESDSPSARNAYALIEVQIQVIALVQRRLPDGNDGQPIDMAGLITELCALLEAGPGLPDAPRLQMGCAVASLALAPDQAMPVALLIAVAALHAARHAPPGPVTVNIAASGTGGTIELAVHAQGLEAAARLPVPRLMAAMVRQLQGTLARDGVNGSWIVRFAAAPA